MSCQQVSRFITTSNRSNNSNSSSATSNQQYNKHYNNSSSIKLKSGNGVVNSSAINQLQRIVSVEDPYVFTESGPTAPPALFSSQKSRARLNDLGKTPQQQRLSLTNGKIAEIRDPLTGATAPALKNVTSQSLPVTAATGQNKKATNVCIVRPQLQQQQQYAISSVGHTERELKSISPPPLYTPTSSLWQTPLFIESTPPAIPAAASPQASALPPASSTLVASLPASAASSGCGSISTLSTTTTMAKVAPIFVQPASSLTPTKFHNSTLGQHLSQSECVKKPKKLVSPLAQDIVADKYDKLESLAKPCVEDDANGLATLKSVTHSVTEELNDIPVNVIFRMALVPQQQQQQQQQQQRQDQQQLNECNNNNKNVNNETFLTPAALCQTPAATTSTSLPSTASNNSQANTPVHRAAVAITTTSANTSPPAPKVKQVARAQQQISKSSTIQQGRPNPTATTMMPSPASQQVTAKCSGIENASPAATKSKSMNTKARKTSGVKAANNCPSIGQVCGRLPLNGIVSKGAVAVVKMPQRHKTDFYGLDLNDLATPSGLPYCVQSDWFSPHNMRKPLVALDKSANRSSLREERIALYKQQLRRQAMQLLSIRSLQRLPMRMSQKRLMCVDRLLRKYRSNNHKGFSENEKHCCVHGCAAQTMEMAQYCQEHISLNVDQGIFLPCTAKLTDNTQCKAPVFDLYHHDLPLCLEHARNRDVCNRFLFDQQPREMLVTNPDEMARISFVCDDYDAAREQPKIAGSLNGRTELSVTATGDHQPMPARKRKATGNPVGRPQKKLKKNVDLASNQPMQRLTFSGGLQRKNSTTSLESLASNSQLSSMSSSSPMSQSQQQLYTSNTTSALNTFASQTPAGVTNLPPPALAPLSSGFVNSQNLPQHLFSFGHDVGNMYAGVETTKHSTKSQTLSPTTELKEFISNLTVPSVANSIAATAAALSSCEPADASFINNNSNSNFTSSGMGSTTSLPTADDFLTQDMLSICENSSVSSVDTGLGGLSDPELMLSGPDADDIPLGDTRLLEEHDLENVLSSLPDDAFKELFSTVQQDESDDIDGSIELADKHLKNFEQSITSEFIAFLDNLISNNTDMCNSSSTALANTPM